jgi:hypothetical protein
MWNDFTEGKSFNSKSFERFFNLRTRRLSSSIMFLIDAVFILEGNFNEDFVKIFMMLGKYCEIKSTILRDLTKNVGDSDINSFLIFKSLHKNEENVENHFLNFKNDELAIMRRNLMNLLENKEDKLKNIIPLLEAEMEKYYKTNILKAKL